MLVDYHPVMSPKIKTFSFRYFTTNAIVRWWIVGFFFMGINIPLLYWFKDLLQLPLPIATLIAAELSTIFRFLINDRWVFHHPKPTWQRLWQYHVASVGSFIIWWGTANLLPQFGIHYLIAAVLAAACSVCWSMTTNFLWIWRRGKQTDNLPSSSESAEERDGVIGNG